MNAESFHRLLTAAYLLYVNNDRTALQRNATVHTNTFTAGAIVQERTPSLLAVESGLLASRSVRPVSPSDFNKSAARIHRPRGPAQGPIPPHAMKLFASRAMFLKAVEALAIATIFSALIGVEIRRPLLALPGRASLLSEMPEQEGSSPQIRPTAELPVSSQWPVVSSGQPLSVREADIVAEDVFVRYPKRVVNRPIQAAKKPAMLAAETVVQYGPDVTMWLGNRTERDGLCLRH